MDNSDGVILSGLTILGSVKLHVRYFSSRNKRSVHAVEVPDIISTGGIHDGGVVARHRFVFKNDVVVEVATDGRGSIRPDWETLTGWAN
jgi:hypothetical protein